MRNDVLFRFWCRAEGSHGCFQVSDLRTEAAEGLAKLIYTGRISSTKIFSRLVLLWYNPVTEDDTRLRHCLGVFFQLYARESRCVYCASAAGW